MFGKKKKDTSGTPLSVCLIGCGPAGMSLLHALAAKKAKAAPDSAEAKSLPKITCYEQAPNPGGIWRDIAEEDRKARDENQVVMYKDLWCRTPKELMEFPDYTWDDHFGKPSPSFLPRRDVLEYLVKRNDAEGILGTVQFSHSVEDVTFSNDQFTVKVKDLESGKEDTKQFDRVVYAGGLHSEPEKPPELLEMLQEFDGVVLHSAECTGASFEDNVKGKHVFIIGDGGSGEDTALRAVKLGAKKVTVSSRSGGGEAYETSSWPEGKVKVVYGPPYKMSKGRDFKCHAVYWNDKRQAFKKDDEEETFKVKSVDTVVLCTGYDYDLDEINADIRMDPESQWSPSKGWTMDNNALTITIGNVKPSKSVDPGYSVYPELYHGMLVSNPSMFYLLEGTGVETSFLNLDVNAWLILGYLTGDIPVPKAKDMEKANQKQLEAEMQIPFIRAEIDGAYREEMNEIDDNHWSENAEDERTIKLERQTAEFMIGVLARDAKTAGYPVDLGEKPGKLSSQGSKLVEMLVTSARARSSIDKESPDASWKTYRDAEPGTYESIFTGTKNAALPGPWMQLKFGAKPKLKYAEL